MSLSIQYVTDLNEVFKILNECCGEPIYTGVGTDEKGCEIALPCYAACKEEKPESEIVKGGAV